MDKHIINRTIDIQKRERLFIAICDIAILIACCIILVQGYHKYFNWLMVLFSLNLISLIAIRQIGMSLLNKTWLDSYLNRSLKRITDFSLAIIYMLTALPIIYLLFAICLRTQKKFANTPILYYQRMHTNIRSFDSLTFTKTSTFLDHPCLKHAPIAINIAAGTLSIWDLGTLQEDMPATSDAPDIASISTEEIIEPSTLVQNNIYSETDFNITELDNNNQTS